MLTFRFGRSGWWKGKRSSSVHTSRCVSMMRRPGFCSRAMRNDRLFIIAVRSLDELIVDRFRLRDVRERFLSVVRRGKVPGAFDPALEISKLIEQQPGGFGCRRG